MPGMATASLDPVRRRRLDPRLQRPPVVGAAAMYLLGMIFLLWPISSPVVYDQKFTPSGSDGSELCGLAITQVFVAPHGPDDRLHDKKIDCAAKARDFAGPGALFLLVAVGAISVALLTPGGRTTEGEAGKRQDALQ